MSNTFQTQKCNKHESTNSRKQTKIKQTKRNKQVENAEIKTREQERERDELHVEEHIFASDVFAHQLTLCVFTQLLRVLCFKVFPSLFVHPC